MDRLIQIALDRSAVSPNGLAHGRGRRPWRREQCLDKPPGLGGVQLNLLAFGHYPAGRFSRVYGDKSGHRAALDRGSFAEKLFVRHRYPGNEALALRFFQCCRHPINVCLCGTQIKS